MNKQTREGLGTPVSSVQKGAFADCAECPSMVVVPAKDGVAVGASVEEKAALKSLQQSYAGMRRTVSIPRFALGETEVTIDQFRAFVDATGYRPPRSCAKLVRNLLSGWEDSRDVDFMHPGFEVTGRNPVGCVLWDDAQAYVKWLAARTGKHYRLPTEAEWEYVARAGTSENSYLGGKELDVSEICQFENVGDEGVQVFQGRAFSCSDAFRYTTAPTKSFKANQLGFFDVLGNVSEWIAECETAQGELKDTLKDPSTCKYGVLKGGSYARGQESGIASFRRDWFRDSSDEPLNDMGFRVARDLN